MGDELRREETQADVPPPREMRACGECGVSLGWTRLSDADPWESVRCWQHPHAVILTDAEARAMKAEKGRRRALVHASMLRALAAIVESSGVPLPEHGSGVSSYAVQAEVSERLR